jgi:hypothetical protein
MSDDDQTTTIHRFVGVYNAEGTLKGEIAYWIGARLGRAHCALCDITHGVLRERSDWRSCRDGLPVPFETFHLDDQPSEVRTVAGGAAPVVVADTSGGPVVLLGPAEIEACQASPEKLERAIEAAVDRAGLRWPVADAAVPD